ncbi:hypothetical protein Q7P37_000677 [Cladosporium fusiforme]
MRSPKGHAFDNGVRKAHLQHRLVEATPIDLRDNSDNDRDTRDDNRAARSIAGSPFRQRRSSGAVDRLVQRALRTVEDDKVGDSDRIMEIIQHEYQGSAREKTAILPNCQRKNVRERVDLVKFTNTIVDFRAECGAQGWGLVVFMARYYVLLADTWIRGAMRTSETEGHSEVELSLSFRCVSLSPFTINAMPWLCHAS